MEWKRVPLRSRDHLWNLETVVMGDNRAAAVILDNKTKW